MFFRNEGGHSYAELAMGKRFLGVERSAQLKGNTLWVDNDRKIVLGKPKYEMRRTCFLASE